MSEEGEFVSTRYKWIPVDDEAWLPMKLFKQNGDKEAIFETLDEPSHVKKL